METGNDRHRYRLVGVPQSRGLERQPRSWVGGETSRKDYFVDEGVEVRGEERERGGRGAGTSLKRILHGDGGCGLLCSRFNCSV